VKDQIKHSGEVGLITGTQFLKCKMCFTESQRQHAFDPGVSLFSRSTFSGGDAIVNFMILRFISVLAIT